MSSKTEEVTKNVSHPMEDVLNIESGTTLMTTIERTSELVPTEEYDNKDEEIDEQFQEVYDSAMGAFEGQMDEVELVEGKYKARNGEVAVQFLNAALSAAKEKSNLKQHKDKTAIAKGKLAGSAAASKPQVIIADRNAILKSILGDEAIEIDEKPPIDVDFNRTE